MKTLSILAILISFSFSINNNVESKTIKHTKVDKLEITDNIQGVKTTLTEVVVGTRNTIYPGNLITSVKEEKRQIDNTSVEQNKLDLILIKYEEEAK